MDWAKLSARAGRNDLPELLTRAVLVDNTLIDPVEICKGIQSAWTMAEWPLRILSKEIWINLFDRVLEDTTEFLDERTVKSQSELPDDLTLYRAASEGYENGLSWTSDYDRAVWFANRFGGVLGEHKLYKLDASVTPQQAVIAHFHEGRGEHEYLVDLDLLDPDDMVEINYSRR